MTRPPLHPEIRLGLAALGAGGLLLALLWGGLSRLAASAGSTAVVLGASGRPALDAAPASDEPGAGSRGIVSYREGSGVVAVSGSGRTRTVPCPVRGSREAWIEGSSLRVRLTGACRRVIVAGESDEVLLEDVTDLRELVVYGWGHRLQSGPLGQTFPTLRASGEEHRFEGGLATLFPEKPVPEPSDG